MSLKRNLPLKKRNLKLQLKISTRKLEDQKPHAIKWSELQENQIYTITNATHIQTRYGDACIITLNNGQQLWAPSSLIKRFKQDKHTIFFTCYVHPTGKERSKHNPAREYYSFDLVWSD